MERIPIAVQVYSVRDEAEADFEFARAEDGTRQLDAFYKAKETERIGAELDLCWVKVGDENPVEYLRKYSGRCPVVHVKDFVREDKVVLVALGDGEVGVGDVVSQAGESGVKWHINLKSEFQYRRQQKKENTEVSS